jgi:hypothetical protein
MAADEHALEIARLRVQLADATARRTALASEAIELAARVREIRAAFGNPFFYSHPEHADESAANYTGNSSHEVMLPTGSALNRVNREIHALEKQLRALADDGD